MKTKYITLTLALAVVSICSVSAYAQNNNGRAPGYHGNLAITDHLGVFIGAETSHGYMFDSHNYLGLGIGGFVLPNDSHPTYMNAFIDYHNYLRDKNTLVLGVKAGWSHAFNYQKDSGIKFENGILCEPNIGWSWCFNSGYGLYLGLGASLIFPLGESRTEKTVLPMPKITFGFEF